MTVLQLIKSSLRLINALATGEAPTAPMSADALLALQTMLDAWSAEGLLVYAHTRESLTLTGAASYTVGSAGDLVTTRPDQIIGAYVTSGGLDYPVNVVDARAYRDIAQKSLSGVPAWISYSPEYPSGRLYVYPVGASGDVLHLDSLKPLTEPTTLTASLSYPPGYEKALKYNLAAELSPEYEEAVNPYIQRMAEESLDVIRSRTAASRAETAKIEILEVSHRWSIDGG